MSTDKLYAISVATTKVNSNHSFEVMSHLSIRPSVNEDSAVESYLKELGKEFVDRKISTFCVVEIPQIRSRNE